MFFDELSNDEWALLAVLVSDEPAVRLNRRGRPRAEPRIVANAVLWILTTGEPWSKLPGRYPSGPTCRRRFEEWQLNGTLLEMVRLLSQTGRTFAYIPPPAPPVAAKPVAPVTETPSMRDEGLRGVSWKSPESWQAPRVSNTLGNWRSADPIADITRQLSGLSNEAPVARARPMPATPAAVVARSAARVDLPVRTGEAGAVGSAMAQLDFAIASARRTPNAPNDDLRSPLSMSLAPRGTQVAGSNGYLICTVAEQVPGAMYRASAEIVKDGKRVERSGLIGPRFAEAAEAEQYALDWAQQWIDRECVAQGAAEPALAESLQSAETHAETHPRVARPLPALRHVPEPVTVNHGAPLHGPINAFRGPLRRYPGEPVAATVTASSVAVNAVTDSTASDRFSSAYIELVSHVG
ncbi:transposase [Paraburkholderia sp. GAS333]|uniref:transposase n=1 Tax=Paraburkholderia sp. GAS333 TaxID=3156279 RepID=UPI003D1FD562